MVYCRFCCDARGEISLADVGGGGWAPPLKNGPQPARPWPRPAAAAAAPRPCCAMPWTRGGRTLVGIGIFVAPRRDIRCGHLDPLRRRSRPLVARHYTAGPAFFAPKWRSVCSCGFCDTGVPQNYCHISSSPATPFESKMGKKSVPFCRELSRNFGVDLRHFSVRSFDSNGVAGEVNNFGVHR